MRNNLLKELRSEWKHNSRFIFGKNRIMQLALGRSEDDETEAGLHKVSARLHGQCGLLFTDKSKAEVLEWAESYEAMEYARSGFVATETVVLPEGPMEEFSHAIEPHLRSLGLPTKLQKGIIHLYKEHQVCEEGKVLTPEQARILKLVAKPMATFTLLIKATWSKADGFESIVDDESTTDSGNGADEAEEEDEDAEME